jgi:hypothetical protein
MAYMMLSSDTVQLKRVVAYYYNYGTPSLRKHFGSVEVTERYTPCHLVKDLFAHGKTGWLAPLLLTWGLNPLFKPEATSIWTDERLNALGGIICGHHRGDTKICVITQYHTSPTNQRLKDELVVKDQVLRYQIGYLESPGQLKTVYRNPNEPPSFSKHTLLVLTAKLYGRRPTTEAHELTGWHTSVTQEVSQALFADVPALQQRAARVRQTRGPRRHEVVECEEAPTDDQRDAFTLDATQAQVRLRLAMFLSPYMFNLQALSLTLYKQLNAKSPRVFSQAGTLA